VDPTRTEGEVRAPSGFGLSLVFLSTVAYGTLPILTKIAYRQGLDLFLLLALRFAIAATFFALIGRRQPALPLRARLRLWGLGAVFLTDTFFYFKALETLSASQTALLFYVYPVLVTLLSALLGIEPLTVRGLAAACLSFAGAGLTVAPEGGLPNLHGILYTFMGAALYATFVVLASRVRAPAQTTASHVAQLGAVVWTALALLRSDLRFPASPVAWATVLGIAFFCTVVAHAAFLAGLARVGPGRAAVVSSFEVIVTVILAVLALREHVGLRPLLGGVLILLAVAIQANRPRRTAALPRPAESPESAARWG
jgi:drug/metabolite transporter (DMT)-like permease